jgi:hypothetical protein
MLQPQALRKAEVAVRAFDFDTATKRVRVELENTGSSLGRVLSSEFSADGSKSIPGGAFPLFPHSRRTLEVPWTERLTPAKVVLRFANFTMEERRKGGG